MEKHIFFESITMNVTIVSKIDINENERTLLQQQKKEKNIIKNEEERK